LDNAEWRQSKKGQFLGLSKNRSMFSALSRARQNTPYAELGIMVIFMRERKIVELLNRYIGEKKTRFNDSTV